MRRTLLLSSILGALSGCGPGGSAPPKAAATPAWAFEKTFNSGTPVTLTLRLSPTELSLSDKVTLEEELRVDDGFDAEFPEYLPEDFEGFSVVEIESPKTIDKGAAPDKPAPAAQAAPAVKVRTKRLTLEPDRSGTLTLAPLAVYFRKAGEKAEQFFLTDEVPITVKAIENVRDLALEPLKGIYEAPPVTTPSAWKLPAGIAAGVLVVAIVALFLSKRRIRHAPPPAPPHELAYDALRRLVALGLVEKGEIELFFVHLSAILREYIERRFEVKAPERTTEEFLDEASRNGALASHRARLDEFLSLSDQVKFARLQPDEKTIQGAFDVVKQFLKETTPVVAQAA